MSEDQKECFVIMPISDAEGYDKGHFTRVYYDIIKPAVESAGHKPIRADEVANSTYIQSMFAVELANFLHYYFPVKRKKDSLVSTDEQDMIIKILHLFKLTPYLVVRSRYRQLLMLADRFKENLSWINLQDQLLPITFIKWKQWNTNNWLEVEYDKLKEGETVSFPPLGSNN